MVPVHQRHSFLLDCLCRHPSLLTLQIVWKMIRIEGFLVMEYEQQVKPDFQREMTEVGLPDADRRAVSSRAYTCCYVTSREGTAALPVI